MFFGRDSELDRLASLWRKRVSSLVTCRGRRRVGKSALVEEFAKRTGARFVKIEGRRPEKGWTNATELAAFAEQLAAQTGAETTPPSNWLNAFIRLSDKIVDGEKTVVLLDEISWLGYFDDTFAGTLKIAWDNYFKKHDRLVLVVCGSVSSWIRENIIDSGAFLGRRSLDIVLKELPLKECVKFWGESAKRIDARDILDVLSVTGGIPRYLEEIDPGLSYNHSGCIPKEEFRRSKIFSNTPSSYVGEDLVFGTYKGIPIRFSELKVQEKHSDGKNTTYHTFFQGVFLIADFNKDFKYSHWVLPDTAEAAFGQVFGNFLQKMHLPGRGHMTRMEDPAFEKKFVVYTEDDVEARYILTPKLMHTMLTLSERFRKGASRIAFAFMNSNVYIAIPIEQGRDLLEMPSHGDLGEETARKTQAELKEILSVFDVMELDLRLWSKNAPYCTRR